MNLPRLRGRGKVNSQTEMVKRRTRITIQTEEVVLIRPMESSLLHDARECETAKAPIRPVRATGEKTTLRAPQSSGSEVLNLQNKSNQKDEKL